MFTTSRFISKKLSKNEGSLSCEIAGSVYAEYPVEFIKRILHDEISSGEMKSGFRKLEEKIPHRVDLSLEYLVTRDNFRVLFSDKEFEFCKKLMDKYGL